MATSITVQTELDVIPIEKFTDATVTGSGIFDVLMRANRAHLTQEFDLGRIRGNEYANVYLGMLEPTMKAAVDFFIQQRKLGLEAELLKIQRDIALIGLEKARVELEIAQLNKEKIPYEIEVLKGQACKLKAEFDVLVATVPKVDTETALLAQKLITEKAQTNGAIGDENSVIGRQRALYKAQTDGYRRDAEQKVAKIMIDTWNVRRTTDEGTEANQVNKLSDSFVGRAVDNLLSGVNA